MEQFAHIEGIRVRYRIEGAGPDLVLVHGVGSQLEEWDGVITALGGHYRTISYDLRGHGGTDKPQAQYKLDNFVSDLRGLLSHLRIERCSLAGFSLGGLIAQAFALSHADRLSRLILLSTVAGRNEDEKHRVLNRLAMVGEHMPGQHFEPSLERWFTDDFRRRNPDLIAAFAERNKRNDPAAYAAAYRVLATSDLADRLSEIKLPTLVATGEHDVGSNTRMAKLMAERIPNSHLHIFPNLRHSILIEAPTEVARMAEVFLSEPGGAGFERFPSAEV